MLFNSYTFLFVFLPIVAATFFVVARVSRQLAALWLGVSSLVFYGYWNAQYVLLLLASITSNYGIGYVIGHLGRDNRRERKAFAVLGISAASPSGISLGTIR